MVEGEKRGEGGGREAKVGVGGRPLECKKASTTSSRDVLRVYCFTLLPKCLVAALREIMEHIKHSIYVKI